MTKRLFLAAGTVFDLPSGRYEIVRDVFVGDVVSASAVQVNGKHPQPFDRIPDDAARALGFVGSK